MAIWLNVTESYFWSRPPVGIIRVERKLFAALDRLRAEPLRYCVYVRGELYEVDPTATVGKAVEKVEVGKATFFSKLRGATSAGAKAAFYYLARESRRAGPVLRVIASWRQRLRHWRPRRMSFPVAAIEPGDIFLTVSIDAHLEYPGLFQKVIEQSGAKLVGFCHDIIPVLYPEMCTLGAKARMTAYFRFLAQSCSVLLCNSECTKTDLLKFIDSQDISAPPIKVVPLGFSFPASESLTGLEISQRPKSSYILFVSTIERRKNHRLLYDIYAEMADHPEFESLPKLCMVGARGWRVDDLLEDIALNDRIAQKFVFLTNVSDAMLASLYRDALFCVYPSLYEGWGLPVSEALAFGKAVIASDAGALPEASGGCALHLSPYDTRAWRDAICRMSTDDTWRREWEERAKRDFKRHDWDHAAQIVAKAIEMVDNAHVAVDASVMRATPMDTSSSLYGGEAPNFA